MNVHLVVFITMSLFFATLVAAQDAAGPRTWTDVTGKFKIEAEFLSLANDQLTLKKADGTNVTLPLTKLSFADRKLAIQMSKGIAPMSVKPGPAVPMPVRPGPANPAPMPMAEVVIPEPAGPKPAFVLTADKLVPEYKANEEATRAKYNDKVVDITGQVISVLHEAAESEKGIVRYGLKGGDGAFDVAYVQMAGGDPLSKATPGHTVTFRGTFETSEVSPCPFIHRAQLVKVTGTGAIPVTTKELAARYSANPDHFKTQFDEKWFLVSGVVGSMGEDIAGPAVMVQEGKLKLVLGVGLGEEDTVKQVKAGDKFRMLVHFLQISVSDETALRTIDGVFLRADAGGMNAPPKGR